MAMSDFFWDLRNSSFCARAVQILPKILIAEISITRKLAKSSAASSARLSKNFTRRCNVSAEVAKLLNLFAAIHYMYTVSQKTSPTLTFEKKNCLFDLHNE